jgi:peptide/nickel transport system substrate-binding protein
MKKRTLFLLMALAVICAPLYAAGTGDTTTVAVEEGKPQYGGTFNLWLGAATSDPGSPDIADGMFWAPSRWLSPVQERPVAGDFEKYGPRGTNEYTFDASAFQPVAYMKGHLLESWKVEANKTTWVVRKGVMWAGNRPDVMRSRELTGEDVAEDLIYFSKAPGGANFSKMFGRIYTTDRYTVVIEYDAFDVNLMYFVGYEDRALIEPPETRAAGASDWKNQVGTGPFMLKEYVVGSHMEYEKNPDYWKTTIIDGEEYKLPFADKLVYPIMPDPTIQVAALRAGKLDKMDVPALYWEDLKLQAPELKRHVRIATSGQMVHLNTTQSPTDNLNVRRALMIGTDMAAFAQLAELPEEIRHWYPVYYGNAQVSTPFEELPAELQELYEYSPEKAKQILAEEGYPNGLTLGHMTQAGAPDYTDRSELLANQWAKFGVTLEIEAVDMVTKREHQFELTYKHTNMNSMDVGNPLESIGRRAMTGAFFNHSGYSSAEMDRVCEAAKGEIDAAKRAAYNKEAAVLMISEVLNIPLTANAQANYWWPWVKNYWSEYSAGDGEDIIILSHAWIDQDLKKSMGK